MPHRSGRIANSSFWPFPAGIPSDSSLALGDFNCEDILLDRLGPQQSSRPESSALDELIDRYDWADARVLRNHAEDEEADETIDPFTYWKGEKASRIKRFYAFNNWSSHVCCVAVRPPSCFSDYQEVELHLRARQRTSQPPSGSQVTYPILDNQPSRVVTELLEEMDTWGWAGPPQFINGTRLSLRVKRA